MKDLSKKPSVDTSSFTVDAKLKSAEIIRPILRGRDIKRYGYDFADYHLIATFPAKRYDIENYPAIKNHLLTFGKGILNNNGYAWVADGYLQEWCYKRLEQTGGDIVINNQKIQFKDNQKSRKATGGQWFETQDSISYWDDFNRQKIVWGEISDHPNFALDEVDNFFVNNKCYLMTGGRLEYLTCFLNSQLSEYLFSKIATTTGVGTLQWSKFTIEQLLVPSVTPAQEQEFIDLLRMKKTERKSAKDIDLKIYELCGLSPEEIEFIDSQ